MMRACYALRPEGIIWPENEDGFPSFRLEHLTRANGVEHEHAHDAMSDVHATIAMVSWSNRRSQGYLTTCCSTETNTSSMR